MSKAVWSSSYVTDLPDSAFACVDSSGRHYPHHDSSGKLDVPHLRAALSRIGDPSNTQCGKGHLEAHAKAEGMGDRGKALLPLKSKALDEDEEEAFWEGKVPRRLLAIPFGGPIPSPKSVRGVDLDDEWFDETTDIFGGVIPLLKTRERLVDFQHSYKPPSGAYGDDTGMMMGHLIGKSILDPDPEEDGWWIDLWLERGNQRVRMVQALAKRGAQLFGSSQPIGKAHVEPNGHIDVWPFWMETMTTVPQNHLSVMRPKSVLDAADDGDVTLPASLRALATELDSLAADLRQDSIVGAGGARLGRSPDLGVLLDAHAKALDQLRSITREE